jgi:murein DD-endopeptidase MepM/ murein hydrolase activator NlpD
MPEGTIPDMLVLLDEHPSSEAGLSFAQRYAARTLALASWSTSTADLATEVQTSVASEPTVHEALRTAATRGIGFVAMRRDFAEPSELLGTLLTAAAKHTGDDIPGFAVLLADGQPRPIRRILAIADRRSGPISGLLTHIAVLVAEATGAAVDTLVLDTEDADIAPDDRGRYWQIDREEELFEAAMQRAADNDVQLTRIPVTTADPWLVITNQLQHGEYDLIIDDLGQVRLGGRRGVERTLQRALGPGEVGETPLRLLREVPIPLLLVIDEIRLGIAPASLLKAGTAAALGMGLIAPAVAAVAAPPVVASGRLDTSSDPVTDLVGELENALGVEGSEPTGADAERTRDAQGSSRDSGSATGRTAAEEAVATSASTAATTTTATQEAKAAEEKKGSQQAKPPKAPKGGADPGDLAKARRDAAASKAALAKDKEKKAKAAKTLASAEEELAAAQVVAESALIELHAAAEAQEQAQATAMALRGAISTEASILPAEPTPEQTMAASEIEASAQERLDVAVVAGEEALATLTTAEEELAAAEEKLEARTEALTESKAEYAHSKEKVEVFKESLAKTRQSPVAKGSYRLTARFGQHGGYWSGGIHTGLDFAGSVGTDIRAAATGTVVSAGWEGSYGKKVVIDHGNGYQTTYSHLSDIRVSVGQKVTAGDHIGDMGSTGNSTGSHLHFEVVKGGKFIDPQGWLGW